MSARFGTSRGSRAPAACPASFEPGSVIATKREPSPPVASRKVSIISGSSVEPDFDAITNSEPSAGMARRRRVGRVEHLQRPAERARRRPAARGSSRPCRTARSRRSRPRVRRPLRWSSRGLARPSPPRPGSSPSSADLGRPLGVVADQSAAVAGEQLADGVAPRAPPARPRRTAARAEPPGQARRTSFTASTTASGEMPSLRATTLPGPRRRTGRCRRAAAVADDRSQPAVTPASIETRAVTEGGSTASR